MKICSGADEGLFFIRTLAQGVCGLHDCWGASRPATARGAYSVCNAVLSRAGAIYCGHACRVEHGAGQDLVNWIWGDDLLVYIHVPDYCSLREVMLHILVCSFIANRIISAQECSRHVA
jgi:hypothetical protein